MKRATSAIATAALTLGGLGLLGAAAHATTAPDSAVACPGPPPTGGPTIAQATQVQQITGSLSAPMNGADLGVAWSDGVSVMHVFGDNGTAVQPAFDGPSITNWQPNAIGFDRSGDISKGIQFGWPGILRPMLPVFSASEDGLVPTGGIHVNGKDYAKYVVFVKNHTGQEQTRANGIAESDDGGLTWHRVYTAVWQNNSSYTDNFQQQAMAQDGDGYVYVFSTPSERHGDVYLMKVPAASILNKGAYQYWNGSSWSSTESSAKPIFAGPAGEMSATYIPTAGKWVAMYNNDNDTSNGSTVLRYAADPTGPWSAPVTVLPDSVRTIYAPMIDPRSTATDLYFYGSDWSTYQTYLFHSAMSLTG